WAWARAELRARWKALVAIGLLAGLAVALASAALAGARRTATAFPRLAHETRSQDATVFASQVGLLHPDFSALRRLPEVRDVAVWDLVFGAANGSPTLLFASDGGTWGDTVNTPLVVHGRMWDPSAPNEVVISEGAPEVGHVGTTFAFRPYAADQPDGTGEPHGPVVTLKVVGVVRTVNQFLLTPDQAFLSPGFVATYGSRITRAPNADVVLRHGQADVAALRRDVTRLIAPGTPVLDYPSLTRRIRTTLDVERVALLALGAVVALAGGLLVAQALARSTAAIRDDAAALRGLGMSRADMALATTFAHSLPAVVAAATTLAGAIALSPVFPVGLGRRVDPHVGVHADWTTLGAGMAIAFVLVLGCAALAALRAARPRPARAGALSLTARVRRAAPVSVGIGTTMALERGAGRSGTAVRPALVGAVVGVLGIVGVLTIDHALSDALSHPERAGVTWDATVINDEAKATPALVAAVQRAQPRAALARIDRALTAVNDVGVPTYTVRPVRPGDSTAIALAVVDGRSPTATGEADIGPATARDLHISVGDTVTVGAARARVRIVGKALYPSDVHQEFDEGFSLVPAQFDELVDQAEDEQAVAVRLPPSVHDKAAAASAMGTALGSAASEVDGPNVPPELANLHNVRTMPVVLAVVLAALAVAALSYVLGSSVRRRDRDFAVLRTLGLSRRGA